jgi:cell division septation protein DedD
MPPPAAPRSPPSAANASANAPISLAPQGAAPATSPVSGAGSGGYLVQVSSQKNEADAQASFRALQGKFPTVLGSRAPLIKRADLGDKGVYYRAMVGPFGSPDEASQFCGSLKTAGGQCVVQRN